MSTIQELYLLRGNPDFSHWRTIKLLTISEASLLTAGIEPCEYNHLADFELRNKLLDDKPTNWQHSLMLIRSLIEAICTHEIKSPHVIIQKEYINNGYEYPEEQSKLGIEDVQDILCTRTKIHRDELAKWLKKNGYLEPSKQSTLTEDIKPQSTEPLIKAETLLLAEPIYMTPALDALHGVIQQFWVSYDPDNNMPPPKQETVMSWIKTNYPDIQASDMCKYIDKICRHPNAKKGGNSKMNLETNTKDTTPKNK